DNPDSTIELTVSLPDMGKRTVTVESGEVHVEVRAAAVLVVQLAHYFGTVAEGRVQLRLQRANENRWSSTAQRGADAIAPDGRVEFDPVEPGAYALHVTLTGEEEWRGGVSVENLDVDLPSGPSTLLVTLPGFHQLAVRFPAVDHTQVQLMPLTGGPEESTSHEGGKDKPLIVPAIPAGDYLVMAMSPELLLMKLEVRGDTDVEFAGVPIDSIRVRTSPGSPLSEMGFENRDLIIGINGIEFENGGQLQLAFMGAMSRDNVKLTVLRNGEKHVIEIDGRAMQSAGSEGSLLPANRALDFP
ncbi:MAG: hypothetical protein KDC38_20490, partial [Planctomycetes bacterium]|nr:hypothetical protein [Planctomycetota bacterium]